MAGDNQSVAAALMRAGVPTPYRFAASLIAAPQLMWRGNGSTSQAR